MTVTDQRPLVSIGLPVRNGATYLEGAIESLLAQTYPAIELIICDNASTDSTPEICERFAASDPRVRYHRNETDVGGATNHNLTFTMARGSYFRWAAHDDLAEPELIERCVKVLEHDPGVVLCHTDLVHIDADGNVIGQVSRNHCSSPRPSVRFATMANARDFCEETYGVIRSADFAATRLQQDYTGSDRTLMSELALRGRFANVEETLFRKRLHEGNRYVDWRTRMAWFGDRYRGRVTLPFWIQFADYLRVIRRVPLTSTERSWCWWVMVRWGWSHRRNLVKDVLVAVVTLARRSATRRERAVATENWS